MKLIILKKNEINALINLNFYEISRAQIKNYFLLFLRKSSLVLLIGYIF